MTEFGILQPRPKCGGQRTFISDLDITEPQFDCRFQKEYRVGKKDGIIPKSEYFKTQPNSVLPGFI